MMSFDVCTAPTTVLPDPRPAPAEWMNGADADDRPPVALVAPRSHSHELANVGVASLTGSMLGFVLSLVAAAIFGGSAVAGAAATIAFVEWARHLEVQAWRQDLLFAEFLRVTRSAVSISGLGMAAAIGLDWLGGMACAVCLAAAIPVLLAWRKGSP